MSTLQGDKTRYLTVFVGELSLPADVYRETIREIRGSGLWRCSFHFFHGYGMGYSPWFWQLAELEIMEHQKACPCCSLTWRGIITAFNLRLKGILPESLFVLFNIVFSVRSSFKLHKPSIFSGPFFLGVIFFNPKNPSFKRHAEVPWTCWGHLHEPHVALRDGHRPLEIGRSRRERLGRSGRWWVGFHDDFNGHWIRWIYGWSMVNVWLIYG